jgi:hypothetical protein
MTDELQPGVRVGRKRIYASDAEKRAAYLARKQLCQLNVTISCDCMELFDGYFERQKADGAGLTKGQVIEKLIRAQLLRKR